MELFLSQSGSTAGASQSLAGGCYEAVRHDIVADVKPDVADVWRKTVAQGASARKRKFEVDALLKNQEKLLEFISESASQHKEIMADAASQHRQMMAKQHEELMSQLRDSQSEIAYLRKFVPPPGAPIDSFRADQQSHLFSAISSGASPTVLGGTSSVPLPLPSEQPHRIPVSNTVSTVSGDDTLKLSQFDGLFASVHASSDPLASPLGS
jgi:hypothetical protein